ncbi:hypothetical protein [Lentilactobacillus senioris]
MPFSIALIGGSTKNQIFGTAMGTLVASLGVIAVIGGVHISVKDFIMLP